MDFMSLLDTANKNLKTTSRKLDEVRTEVDDERRAELKRIEAEKREKMEMLKRKKAAMPSKPVPEEKKFTIPKKNKDKAEEDKAKVMAYMAKKAEEERQLLKKKQAEKDKLIQLRMQAHGGKATKRMAKGFGMSALELQMRYGHNHEHVERLQKQQWREEEEQDMLASQYRNGVYKAIEQKKKIEEKVGFSDVVKTVTKKVMRASGALANRQPHRVATSKTNSLAGLSSRHQAYRDHFSPPREAPKPKPEPVPEKKIKPAPVVDFNALMKAAKDIADGKKTTVDIDRIPPKTQNVHSNSSSRSVGPSGAPKPKSERDKEEYARLMEKNRSSNGSAKPSSSSKLPPSSSSSSKKPDHRPQPSHVSSSKPISSSSSRPTTSSSSHPPQRVSNEIADEKKKDKDKDSKGRFKKGPTPPPAIPPAVPGKRYLPGDIRYKQTMEMAKQTGAPLPNSLSSRPSSSKIPTSSQSSARELDRRKAISADRDRDRIKTDRPMDRDKERDRYKERDRARPETNHRDYRDRERERDREMERRRERERERIRLERERERHRHQSYNRAYNYDDYDEEQDDDEYDSELDDFIDDSGMDMDEISRQEFEETLKMVNPKYNKRKWREREQTISLKDMQADYRTIVKEEARSARIGLIEDLNEATKGRSEAL